MFDVAPTELMLLALVALVVIGPKDLPRLLRVVGNWVGRARTMARHFRSGLDEMVRQSELDDLQKKWAEENERIMREHPVAGMDTSAPLVSSEVEALAPNVSTSLDTNGRSGGETGQSASPELPLSPPDTKP